MKQLTLRPDSAAEPRDVLEQLREMGLRGEPMNCFQINRSEIDALLSGIVPDAIHVIIGTSRYANGTLVADTLWTQLSSRVFNNVRVASTRCPWTEGANASFSDYVTFGVQSHSINKAEIMLDSFVCEFLPPRGNRVRGGDEQLREPEPPSESN